MDRGNFLKCGVRVAVFVGSAGMLVASAFGEIAIRCDYPGGNVKVLGIDESTGTVRVAPDLRDTPGYWFHFDFTVTGAAGRTLHFQFPANGREYLSTLGPAISRDAGKTWRWLNADGRRHEPANAFDYAFAADEHATRFAVSIPYTQKDWDAFVAPYRARTDVKFGTLCKSRSGKRDVEFLHVPCRGRAEWLFVLTARHHACETTGNPPMEGALAVALGDSPEADWLRAHADCCFVPFMDKDGVEEGDQGKNRRPYDHNRDYAKGLYPTVRAVKDLIVRESSGKRIVFIDLHAPHVRTVPKGGGEHDQAFTFGADNPELNAHWNTFRAHWKAAQRGGRLVYDGNYDIPAGKGYWNVMKKAWDEGRLSSDPWVRTLPNAYLATCCEFGYSLCGGVNSVPAMRELGGNMFKAAVRTARDAESPTFAGAGPAEVVPSSWSAVDGLGRFLPEREIAGPLRTNRFVGVFFWTWHDDYSNDPSNAVNRAWASQGRGIGTLNVQKVMDEHPEAKNDYNHPAWKNVCRDGKLGSGHWSEPIWGYYYSHDEWVLRRQGLLLAEAGADVIVFDTTNGLNMWEKGYMALGRVFTQMKREGIAVPGFAFMCPIHKYWFGDYNSELNRQQLRTLWEKVYSRGLFREVWFYWKGKPLVMGHPEGLDPNDPVDREILAFFTFRPTNPLYCEKPTHDMKWGWLATYPQAVCYNADGTPEEISVGVAQNINQEYVCKAVMFHTRRPFCGVSNAMNGFEIFGRSYTSQGFDPRPMSKLYGANFQEQWDYARKVDPEFVFVTGWNEWISGPKPFREVPNGFSDQFDEEHSRDCEPSKGNLKDHYYYQLCANIRRFKGVADGPALARKGVVTTFRDYRKNLSPRDSDGYYPYRSDTGRNALETARVSHDDAFVTFEAESPKPLSAKDGTNWMRLLIRTNREGPTWEGFQFVLNRTAPGETATLERSTGGWNWTKVADCEYAVAGNVLRVKVPRKALKVETPKFELRFKWCDNNLADGDILSLYTDGDAMPGGRFTFLYRADDLDRAAAFRKLGY